MSEILRVENVERVFEMGGHKVHALNGVNLRLDEGDYIAIMGPSGSGKTTLLNVLGCLDKPTGGSIFIDGTDVTQMNGKELAKVRRDKIGFIFQSFNLLPILDAKENVELPMECAKKSKEKRRQRAIEVLNLVGLSERKDHRPHELSAGEQQRVAVARAFANKPSIILADEPTGNLDSETGIHIMKLLGKLNKELGTTVIVVTHDDKMASLTSKIIRLKDGQVEGQAGKMRKSHSSERCS